MEGNQQQRDDGDWPYPFDRFSDADPVSKSEHYLMDDDEVRRIREEAARTKVEAEPEPEAEVEVDTPDLGVLTPDEIISPDNDYELNDNVAVDLVKYIRSSTIRNEQQFLLLTLAYTSGLSADTSDYISSVTIGTSSSGKTHLKDEADRLFVNCDVMDATTGSDKALIYDDDWDGADIISMGELQQPPEELLEFMKRAHGGDDEVVIRSTRGNPAEGFDTETIRKEAKSYHFTYAQNDADFEFWNRLLKIPVHESESKNRAVGRMAFGHGDIGLDDDHSYGHSFEDGTERLQAHMLDVKRHAPPHVVIPNGGEEFDWDAWEVLEPIFKHGRSESNRVYQMVRNLVKASARLNYQSRESVPFKHVATGSEGMREVEMSEATIAEPQDVANVARCLDVLRASTHEIGPRKRAVVEAIKTKSGEDNTVEGVEPIIEFLEESDASKVNKPELESILDDLEDDYLIVVDGDEIQARNWDALGEPEIGDEDGPFANCIDPITEEPFLESWTEYRQEAMTTGEDLLETPEIESTGCGIEEVPTHELAQDIGEELEMEEWETTVAGYIVSTLHNTRVRNMSELPVEGFVGATDPSNPDVGTADVDGTVLDPHHNVWREDDKPQNWVNSSTEARRKVQEVINQLVREDVLEVDVVHKEEDGKPVDVTLSVALE